MSFPPVLTLLLAIGGGSGLVSGQRGKEAFTYSTGVSCSRLEGQS